MSAQELREGFVQATQECYSVDAYFQRLDAQFVTRISSSACIICVIGQAIVGPGQNAASSTMQVRRGGLAFTPLRSRHETSVEIQAAALAHIRSALARAAHLVYLRSQGRDALSLYSYGPGTTGKRAHWERATKCRTFLLARQTARRGAGRCLALRQSRFGQSGAAAVHWLVNETYGRATCTRDVRDRPKWTHDPACPVLATRADECLL